MRTIDLIVGPMFSGRKRATMTLAFNPARTETFRVGDYDDGYRVACRDCWQERRAMGG
jgi:hypothetical protein